MENLWLHDPSTNSQSSACSLASSLRPLLPHMSTAIIKPEKKRITAATAWRDARELIWAHRYRLALGMFLMIVNRLAGLVLPSSSKYVIDEVVIKHRSQMLVPLAMAAGAATLIQALSSFSLSQVLGVRRNALSLTCARACRNTSRGCQSAISIRRKPAC